MNNANLLVLTTPLIEQLIPAVDNALRQIMNGIIGIRNLENRRKIEAISAKHSTIQALVFAMDFGFCARLLLKSAAKGPGRIPKKLAPFGSDISAGWVEVAPGQTTLYYPKDPLASDLMANEVLAVLSETNIREAFKEGMTTIFDDGTWKSLLALAERTSQLQLPERLSLESMWNRIRSGGTGAGYSMEEALHLRRSVGGWVYEDKEIYELVGKCLSSAKTAPEEEAHLQFIAGLCAYHQRQFDSAVKHISWAYGARFPCSWINEALAQALLVGESERDFKGKDGSVYDLYKKILRAAMSDRPVLIVGDRGTGKELVAREIHKYSRPGQPLVAINIGALTGDIIHSELFGHEKGSAGADKANMGAFGRAEEGTLFIDEIGNADLKVQKKLLRVIEYGKYYRVGGETELGSKARILCATNRDLTQLVKKNGFMEDLLHRISVFQIQLKPLREMGNDVVRLLEAELPDVSFGEDARELIGAYDWPGNFRELKAVAERIRATDSKYVFREDLGAILKVHISAPPETVPRIDYDVSTIQEFREQLKHFNDQEIRKYVCNQYLKQKRDWKRMLEAISSRREHRHNTRECLRRCGLTERSVDRSCSASLES